MSVIVYGHVAHATTVPLTPPIYLKQFGVAFFLFATGFTLARERRSRASAVFNRLFQVYCSASLVAPDRDRRGRDGAGRAQQLPAVRRRAERGRRPFPGEPDHVVPRHLPASAADLGGVAAPRARSGRGWWRRCSRSRFRPRLLDASPDGSSPTCSYQLGGGVPARHGTARGASPRGARAPLPFAAALVAGLALWAQACAARSGSYRRFRS